MSLKELWLERRYARDKQRNAYNRDVTLAWQIMKIKAQTQHAKRLPPLRSLLDRDPPADGAASQKAILYQLSAQLGVPVERRPRG